MDYAMHHPWGGRGAALHQIFGALLNESSTPEEPTDDRRGERRGRGHRHGGPSRGRMGGHGPSGGGPSGGGPFGPGGFGPTPFGPGGFGTGPFGGRRGGRARRGDVRNAALLLIAEQPRNGYQIIQELDNRSGGRWKPSPGAIYPALNQLEDEGLIRLIASEAGKAYEITDAGRAEAEATERPTPWEQDDDAAAHPAAGLAQAYGQAWSAVGTIAQSGNADLIAQATAEVEDLKRRLYQLLAES